MLKCCFKNLIKKYLQNLQKVPESKNVIQNHIVTLLTVMNQCAAGKYLTNGFMGDFSHQSFSLG